MIKSVEITESYVCFVCIDYVWRERSEIGFSTHVCKTQKNKTNESNFEHL